MDMQSGEYWARRFAALEKTQIKSDAELAEEIDKLYRQAQREIESKISRWYMKFAQNNEISMADAKKLLKQGDLEEFKWSVDEYIQHGENNLDDAFTKQLVNASSNVHISRYESLLTELQATAVSLMGNQETKLTEHLKDAYSKAYRHTAYEIQKGTGVGFRIGGIDEKSLETVLKKPWAADGSNFSDRIWKDKQSLLSELDTQLKRNILLGKGPDEAAAAIAKRFETSKANAYRLIQTESAAISSKAHEDCFHDLDVEEFEIVETLDRHTCPICGAMDGKHFPMTDYAIGVTVPPFHPNCRGTTVPYYADLEGYGERAARNANGETYFVPVDTTYEQWEKSQKEFTNADERGIINTRNMAMGLRQPASHILTDNEIASIKEDAKALGIDEALLRFNTGNRTGFSDDSEIIEICGDVLPDVSSKIARDCMSKRAVLAHEYYGHYMNHPSEYDIGDWRDEFRASYDAAVKAPNLTDKDRAYLMIDAYDRAREAGQILEYDETARRIIYGF